MSRSINLLVFCALLTFLVGCDHSNPISHEEIQRGSLGLVLNRAAVPPAVRLITLSLSRENFPTMVRDIPVADSSIAVRIDSVAVGTWRLQADAKDAANRIIYTGWAFVEIFPGEITSVTLRLQAATGTLEVTLIWPGSRLVIFHDFNDGLLPNWGGGALLENINGVLKFTTTEEISIKWEIFDHGFPGQFTKGVFSCDARFGHESTSIALSGHSAQFPGQQDWGPYAIFNNGRILYHQPDSVIATEHTYVVGDWYHIRIEFDNKLGEKGRYSLIIRNITTQSPELKVGEFDYLGRYGRLLDVVQYTFVGNTLGQVPATSYYLDNVRLEVE